MSRFVKIGDVVPDEASRGATTHLRVAYFIDWEAKNGSPITDADRLRITYQVYEPGGKHNPHSHDAIEQAYYILEGRGRVHVGDEVQEVGPQTFVHIPAKVDHWIEVLGESRLVHLLVNVKLD